MERYFQISDQFLDLCRVRRQRSGDVCVASRRSNLLHCRGGDICGVIGVSVEWVPDGSPFVRMWRDLSSVLAWKVRVPTFSGSRGERAVLLPVVVWALRGVLAVSAW